MHFTNFPEMVLFDLDHTLLKVNCSFSFGKYLYAKKVFSFTSLFYLVIIYFFHKLGILSITTLHDKIFNHLFKGKSFESIDSLARNFVKTHLHQMLYPPAIKELLRAQEKGHFVAILSSSPSFLVKLISEALDVAYWDASHYSIDENQKFSSILRLVDGKEKADYVAACAKEIGVHKGLITAYTDSILDLPFLQSAGNKVAVNPDRKLRALSYTQQWQII